MFDRIDFAKLKIKQGGIFMLSNYAHQKELMQARIDLKTHETLLENIIYKNLIEENGIDFDYVQF
jgi:hypothetical protein